MAVTLQDFAAGWVTKWQAASALDGIDGPYSDQEPPETTPDFPYAVFTATASLDGMANDNERYRVILDVSIYHSTKTLAATSMALVKGVFTIETGGLPSLAAGKGTVISARVIGDVQTAEDKKVFRHRCTWEYIWTVPRS